MKIFKHIGRHEGEVIEDGRRIDYAIGRQNVGEMRKRHGLDAIRPPRKDTNEIPTGFEDQYF